MDWIKEIYFDSQFGFDDYKIKFIDAVTELTEDILKDGELNLIMISDNAIEYIKTEFFRRLQDLIEDKFATYEFFEIYNILTDDKKFYILWKENMFDYIYNLKRKII